MSVAIPQIVLRGFIIHKSLGQANISSDVKFRYYQNGAFPYCYKRFVMPARCAAK